MALVRSERFEFPEMVRRLVGGDWETGWLRVEEFRDGGDLVVRAELPGVDPDKDVEIAVDGELLHIRAHKEERTENRDKDSYRSEFHYGAFTRELLVPPGTKAEDVTAHYEDGVLDIRVPMPKEPKSEATKVPVTRT